MADRNTEKDSTSLLPIKASTIEGGAYSVLFCQVGRKGKQSRPLAALDQATCCNQRLPTYAGDGGLPALCTHRNIIEMITHKLSTNSPPAGGSACPLLQVVVVFAPFGEIGWAGGSQPVHSHPTTAGISACPHLQVGGGVLCTLEKLTLLGLVAHRLLTNSSPAAFSACPLLQGDGGALCMCGLPIATCKF